MKVQIENFQELLKEYSIPQVFNAISRSQQLIADVDEEILITKSWKETLTNLSSVNQLLIKVLLENASYNDLIMFFASNYDDYKIFTIPLEEVFIAAASGQFSNEYELVQICISINKAVQLTMHDLAVQIATSKILDTQKN